MKKTRTGPTKKQLEYYELISSTFFKIRDYDEDMRRAIEDTAKCFDNIDDGMDRLIYVVVKAFSIGGESMQKLIAAGKENKNERE